MTVQVLQGDCLLLLSMLPSGSVNTCVTSPPYWGLRDYGTAKWEGGDPACDHRSPTMREGRNEDRAKLAGSDSTNSAQLLLAHRSGCGKCGAIKIDSQLGLESTPAGYVEKMVAVFREVRRVLRDDGTLWLNLGDSYAGGGNYRGVNSEETLSAKQRSNGGARGVSQLLGSAGKEYGLAPKNLVGIPWRVAFALQADGWYLRQDIIWHKPNPMPESVRDRCTKAHEYLFLLAKSERYYFDADAIAEPASYPDDKRRPVGSKGAWQLDGREQRENGGGSPYEHDTTTRNKRSVWTVTTKPFKGAHFATFPPDLIEPCILAGCPASGTVLDPFGGAGTTGVVAQRHGRNAILCELNQDYVEMAEKRIAADRISRVGGNAETQQ